MVLPPSREEAPPLDPGELASLPIFPLPRVVLLPGGTLPLHIFEPRYRSMMHDCIEKGPRAMAVAMLAPGWERDYEGRPPIVPVAGAGRIAAHRKNPDGTFDLVLEGVARVRLHEHPPGDSAYRRARATVLADVPDGDDPALRRVLEPVLATASSLAAIERGQGRTSVPTPDLSGTPGRIADRLADRWVHDAARRQRILETTDVAARIAVVGDALATMLALLSRARTQRDSDN
jgi:Lon protease-like protein